MIRSGYRAVDKTPELDWRILKKLLRIINTSQLLRMVSLSGYSSDDINKFIWMVRIGGSTEKGAHIKESDYFTPQVHFEPSFLLNVKINYCFSIPLRLSLIMRQNQLLSLYPIARFSHSALKSIAVFMSPFAFFLHDQLAGNQYRKSPIHV